LKYSNHNSW